MATHKNGFPASIWSWRLTITRWRFLGLRFCGSRTSARTIRPCSGLDLATCHSADERSSSFSYHHCGGLCLAANLRSLLLSRPRFVRRVLPAGLLPRVLPFCLLAPFALIFLSPILP